MDLKRFVKMISIFSLLLAILSGCPKAVWISKQPPGRLEGFMSAKWGASIEECKLAIEMDRNKWFQDCTEEPSHALYAFGTYLEHPALFSYFFTTKSKRLYRVDVTFTDLKVYEKAKNTLIQKYNMPSYSQPGIDHWSWDDKSLLILQRDSTHVQISYSRGPFLIQNQKEGGLLGK